MLKLNSQNKIFENNQENINIFQQQNSLHAASKISQKKTHNNNENNTHVDNYQYVFNE